jgi:hypothetical protein
LKFPMSLLTQQLIGAGAITAEQAAKVEAELAKDLGKTEEEVIIAQGFVEEKKLFELKSRWLGIPLILDPPRGPFSGDFGNDSRGNRQVLPNDPVGKKKE